MKKRLFICVLALAMSLSLTACGGSSGTNSASTEDSTTPEPKVITVDDLTITLTSDYGKSVTEEYDMYYSNGQSICIGNRESKEDLTNNKLNINSINEYASYIMKKSEIESEINSINDNTASFEWSKTLNDKDYSYIACVTMSEDSYWLIQFGCSTKDYEELKPQFLEYFDTIKIN